MNEVLHRFEEEADDSVAAVRYYTPAPDNSDAGSDNTRHHRVIIEAGAVAATSQQNWNSSKLNTMDRR